jgi:hypothetical protein
VKFTVADSEWSFDADGEATIVLLGVGSCVALPVSIDTEDETDTDMVRVCDIDTEGSRDPVGGPWETLLDSPVSVSVGDAVMVVEADGVGSLDGLPRDPVVLAESETVIEKDPVAATLGVGSETVLLLDGLGDTVIVNERDATSVADLDGDETMLSDADADLVTDAEFDSEVLSVSEALVDAVTVPPGP